MVERVAMSVAVCVAMCATAACDKGDSDGGAKAPPKPAKSEPEPPPPPPPDKPAPIRVEGGFATPESVVLDWSNDVYYVSNINGGPADKDGNGFISKLDPDGTIVALKWIDGLNAPKGMTVFLDTLWVTDIDVVRKFDVATGKPAGEIAIKGAAFLNDITQMAGVVYVSDSEANAVYAIAKDGTVSTMAKGPQLNKPNGLIYADRLFMVTFGANELHTITSSGNEVRAQLPKGGLDGVEMVLDDLFVSSWECGCIYRGKLKGPFEPVIENVKAPADIGWDARRKRLLVPLFEDNAVLIYSNVL